MTTSTIRTSNRRNQYVKLSTRIALTFTAILGALTLSAGVAYAGDSGPARRGQPCQVEGSYARDKSGDLYVCEKRKDDPCPVWHSANPRPGNWGQPSPCVCPSKSPSASPSTSPSASKSPSSSPSSIPSTSKSASAAASPSTDVQPSLTPASSDDKLPVTGTRDVVLYGGIGLVLLAAGLLLRFGPRLFRRRSA